MSVARQALAVARIEQAGTAEEKARVAAWDRLYSMLSVLDSKTSVLLRFNAIVVAALAYLVVFRSTDPLSTLSATARTLALGMGHLSLVLSVVSCGFAFPVINVEWGFFGSRIDRMADGPLAFDQAALENLATLVARRTWLYSRAWQLAVAGGTGFAIVVAIATIH